MNSVPYRALAPIQNVMHLLPEKKQDDHSLLIVSSPSRLSLLTLVWCER